MHRYYTRNRDSKPSRKVHSVSATECYWLSAQLQTIVQRASARGSPGKVSRFKSFAKPSFSLTPFRSRGTRGNAFICANTLLSLNRVSIERGINTRNLYIEHFCILISVAINPFWFFDISKARNDSIRKKCPRWENSSARRKRYLFFFFYFVTMPNRILVELTAKAERYFAKNNRVKCKFMKRDAL